MDYASLRNFKDFLQQYNKITETCFSHCINTLGDRAVSPEEFHCVDLCAMKHIRMNHKVMQVFLEVNPTIMNRRIEEMNQAQEQAAVAVDDTSSASVSESVVPQPVESPQEQLIESSSQPLTSQS